MLKGIFTEEWKEEESKRIEGLNNLDLFDEQSGHYPNYETGYGELLDQEIFTYAKLKQELQSRLINIGFIEHGVG